MGARIWDHPGECPGGCEGVCGSLHQNADRGAGVGGAQSGRALFTPKKFYASMNYVTDDGGRSHSNRPKQRNDCVVRAIAIASARPYDEVYDEMASAGRKSGRGTSKDVWQVWLSERADRVSFPAVAGQERMKPGTFCQLYPVGRWVIQMAGHVAAVVDGVVHDAEKPRETACVYAAWQVGYCLAPERGQEPRLCGRGRTR